MIARINVTDMEQYKEYMKLTPDIIQKFGGRFVARGGDVLTLEGEAETHRVVILEFPSREQIVNWYNSPEYQHAISVRKDAADAQFIVVDGV